MRAILVFIIPFCFITSLSGQGQADHDLSDRKLNRNALYVEGEFLIFLGNATLNYERVLNPEGKTHFGLCLGIGPGYLADWGTSEWEPSFKFSTGPAYKLKVNIFWDAGFQISLGIVFMDYYYPGTIFYGREFKPYDVYLPWPAVSLGYRSVGKPFLFRIHLGSLGLGLGLGYAF